MARSFLATSPSLAWFSIRYECNWRVGMRNRTTNKRQNSTVVIHPNSPFELIEGMAEIKEWYQEEFPTDELGAEINPTVTFEDLKENLPNVYDCLGVSDSFVRERVFTKLANLLSVGYDEIYYEWLNND